MKWTVLHSGVASAQQHMDEDQKLLLNISNLDQPLLRFYDWEGPSATYGYFIDPFDYLDREGIEKIGLKLGRRPTGGGIVFHLTDLAFSVLIPASHPAYSMNTLENYAFVNKRVVWAIANFKKGIDVALLREDKTVTTSSRHFCMARPTIYDVMVDGKKVGGAAQRRTRHGFLHQGTISLALPDETLLKCVLKAGTQIFEEMKEHSYLLAESVANLNDIRAELRHLLTLEFKKN